MTRTEAARMIATSHNTVVCYFTKRTTGETRRMVLRYAGDAIKGGLVRVWDLERGAWRTVNLDAVQRVKVLGSDRPAIRHERTSADLQAELAEMFY